MTRAEILEYMKRHVLKHKIRKGTCQACGANNVERYRLATKNLCRHCVEWLFDKNSE